MTGSISPNIPTKGEPLGSSDGKIRESLVTLRDGLNSILGSGNKVSAEGMESTARMGTWYTPKIIAAEESRTNTSYGTLTTPDEITNVVVPTNGLLAIGYVALVKESVSTAGRVAIFLGANQLKKVGGTTPIAQEVELFGTGTFQTLATQADGLDRGEGTSFVTTGQVLAHNRGTGLGGLCYVFVAAGTYNVSIQYKATSGSVTAKERKLWVGVLGS